MEGSMGAGFAEGRRDGVGGDHILRPKGAYLRKKDQKNTNTFGGFLVFFPSMKRGKIHHTKGARSAGPRRWHESFSKQQRRVFFENEHKSTRYNKS